MRLPLPRARWLLALGLAGGLVLSGLSGLPKRPGPVGSALRALPASWGIPAAQAAQPAGYAVQGQCAGWPRAAVSAAPGHCVALIAGPAQGLRMPRRLLEVSPGRFWLTDMGGWDPKRGRLLELTLAQPASGAPRATLRLLADKLDRPHGLARGPDGRVYVGEAGQVWRSPVDGPLQREVVVTDLPADGAHPLKELAFGPQGQLFINIGSATDACRGARQQQPHPCPETQGPRPRAAVYLAQLGGPQFTLQRLASYATGLRNSLALAWEPTAGVLWQGENSVDYPDAQQPPEELNRLQPGSQHGWPACVGAGQPARGYAGRGIDCSASTAPHHGWPAHAAPLHMLIVPRNGPAPWAGQMLVAWHGYRDAGHRVVGFALDTQGRPARQPMVWLGDQALPGQPLPAPTGLALDSQGRLFVLDDRQHAVLMLAR